MFEQADIQNLDIEDIPSTRRNPVIADLFQRMNFMERRGSGYKKILTALQNDESKIKVRSDTFFKVTLYNSLYKNEDYKKIDINKNKKTEINSNNEEKVLLLIKENNKITQVAISESLDITRRTVINIIKKLKDESVIKRIGSDRNGYWKILK